jgi:hypothetical protein
MRSSRRPEESGRFLKKAAQKLLLPWGIAVSAPQAPKARSFFAAFCEQKVAFLSALKHNWFGLIML